MQNLLQFLAENWEGIGIALSLILHKFPKKTVAYKAADVVEAVLTVQAAQKQAEKQ